MRSVVQVREAHLAAEAAGLRAKPEPRGTFDPVSGEYYDRQGNVVPPLTPRGQAAFDAANERAAEALKSAMSVAEQEAIEVQERADRRRALPWYTQECACAACRWRSLPLARALACEPPPGLRDTLGKGLLEADAADADFNGNKRNVVVPLADAGRASRSGAATLGAAAVDGGVRVG